MTKPNDAVDAALAQALAERDAMLAELNADPKASEESWARRLAEGPALRLEWARNGMLVPPDELCKAWGRTREALDEAEAAGELFSVTVADRPWYPAGFLKLAVEDVKRVCQALGSGDPDGKFIFWAREHRSLLRRTVAQAIQDGELDEALELASGWADERGWLTGTAGVVQRAAAQPGGEGRK